MMNQKEIINLLSDKTCVMRVSGMPREQLAELFGYEFSILKDYNQNNPHHHLDLLNHTLTVLSNVYDPSLSPDDGLCLALAALLHDIGKPATAKRKGNRTVYYGHPISSRSIADNLLHSYGFSEELIRRVLFFICYHDAFINFKLPDELSENTNPYLKPIAHDAVKNQIKHIQTESVRKYDYRPEINDFLLLLKLCAADAMAQAKTVCQNGRQIDTRENKLLRIHVIAKIIMKME